MVHCSLMMIVGIRFGGLLRSKKTIKKLKKWLDLDGSGRFFFKRNESNAMIFECVKITADIGQLRFVWRAD